MKTIKIILKDDGSIASSSIGFQINQHSYNDTLINVYVPSEILNTETDTETYNYGNNVAMSMYYTMGNGSQKQGNIYYFTFVKNNVVIEGKTYTLFERKMPREFTLYYGTQNYALNVILYRTNISVSPNVTEIVGNITSANFELYINQSINMADNPQEVETDLSTLIANVNSLLADIVLKQDKTDNGIQVAIANGSDVDTNVVVNALNCINNRIKENYTTNGLQEQAITGLDGRLTTLEEQAITGFRYIATATAQTEPNAQALDLYEQVLGYTKQNGDVIIWIYQIEGETDQTYRCIYSVASGWTWYEIPPMELASNDSAGIVQGNYGNDTTSNILASIVGGKITDIYFRNGVGSYDNLRTKINQLITDVSNIISGTTAVGKSTYAEYDYEEINKAVKTTIPNKYLTKQLGATKEFVQDYALPKEFNDVYQLKFETADYGDVFSNDDSVVATETTHTFAISLGDTEILDAKLIVNLYYKYTLSSKNSFRSVFYVSTTNATPNIVFTLNVYYSTDGTVQNETLIASTSTEPLDLNGTARAISISDYFNLLDNVGIEINGGEYRFELIATKDTSGNEILNLISTTGYISTFSMSTDSYTICASENGIIVHNLVGEYDSDYNILKFNMQNVVLVENTQHLFDLELPNDMAWNDIPMNCCYQLQIDGADISLILNTEPNEQYMGLLYRFFNGYSFVFNATCIEDNGSFTFVIDDANTNAIYLPRRNDVYTLNDKQYASDELVYMLVNNEVILDLSIWFSGITIPQVISRVKAIDTINDIIMLDTHYTDTNGITKFVYLKLVYDSQQSDYEFIANPSDNLKAKVIGDTNVKTTYNYTSNIIQNRVEDANDSNKYAYSYLSKDLIEMYCRKDGYNHSRMDVRNAEASFYTSTLEDATQYMPKRQATSFFGILNYPYMAYEYYENDVSVVKDYFFLNYNGFRVVVNDNELEINRTTNKLTYNNNEVIDEVNITNQFLTDAEMNDLIEEVYGNEYTL